MPLAQYLRTLLQLVDLVVERLEADPQLLGGRGLVAVVALQDDLDVFHLDVAERRVSLGDLEMRAADRGGVGRGGRDGIAADGGLGREMLGSDRSASGEDRGAFDGVRQLADV